jgi:uncharacterized protein
VSVIRVVAEDLSAPASVTPILDGTGRESHGVVATAILLTLHAYKIVLSPFVGGSCRFVPSCSDYAVEAIKTHGAGVGAWLTMKRLARCHPLCRAGYDPVPSRDLGQTPTLVE